MAEWRESLPSGRAPAADDEGLRPLACEDEEGLPTGGMALGVCSSGEEGVPGPESSGRTTRRRWLAGLTGGAALLALALLASVQLRRQGAVGELSEQANHIVDFATYFVREKGSTQVTVSIPIKGVDYGLLMKDADAQHCLTNAVKAAIASTATMGVKESDVWVVLASDQLGVLAQADVAAGEIRAPQVKANLKEGAEGLGNRISMYVGLKRCKQLSLVGAQWPMGQVASVPAASIKCEQVTCPEEAEKAKDYSSKHCSGAACVSECCNLPKASHGGALGFLKGLLKDHARAFKPPPAPKAEKSPEPAWMKKVNDDAKKASKARLTPAQAECNKKPGFYYNKASGSCEECEEGTFSPGGLDRCASCPVYSRRRRAAKCTECAEAPPSLSPTPANLEEAPKCSYLALATDGLTFTFSLQFKYRIPEVSVHLLQASSFTLLLAGKEHGKRAGKVFFAFEPLNKDPSLPPGGFYIYSKRHVEPGNEYTLTVAKNTTHLCLTIVPTDTEQDEEGVPNEIAVGMTKCESYAEYAERDLFHMKQPGQITWGSADSIERSNYKQTQGAIVISLDLKNVLSGTGAMSTFESTIQKTLALYAGPGFHTDDVTVSALSQPKYLDMDPWHLPGMNEEDKYIEIGVEATLLSGKVSAPLLDEMMRDTEGLEQDVTAYVSEDREAALISAVGNRRLEGPAEAAPLGKSGVRRLEGPAEVEVVARIGTDAERSCAGRLCPAGTKLAPERRCAGASCLETCCVEMTCHEYGDRCSPMHRRPEFPVVMCKGKEDCDDKCCIGRCGSFDCLGSGASSGTYCPKHNASKLWYTASKALLTCCNKAACCTQNRPPCLACQQCQRLDSYCKDLVKKTPDIKQRELRSMGCIEDKVPECNMRVQASFHLHQGTDPEPKPVNSVAVLAGTGHAITGGQDGMGWIWNVGTGQPRMALPDSTGAIYSVTAHGETEFVSIGGEDGKAYVYHWRSGYLKHTADVNDKTAGPIFSLVGFQEWHLFGLGFKDGYVRIYNSHNGDVVRLPFGPKNGKDYEDGIKDYMKAEHKYFFDEEDPLIRVAAEKIFDEQLEELPPVPFSKVPPNPVQTWGPVTKIVYFPSGFNFATGHGDGIVRYWSATDGKYLNDLKGHNGAIRALSADFADENLYSGGQDGLIMKWDPRRAKHLYTINVAYAGEVTDIKVVFATGEIYSSHSDGTVRRWKASDGSGICKFQTHGGRVNGIAHTISAQRHNVITASQDGIARVWEPTR